MQYAIGFLIPFGVNQIEEWKEKLEFEIKKIEKIIEDLNLPYVFPNNVEATGAAQLIKDLMGKTEIIIEISVEPVE